MARTATERDHRDQRYQYHTAMARDRDAAEMWKPAAAAAAANVTQKTDTWQEAPRYGSVSRSQVRTLALTHAW